MVSILNDLSILVHIFISHFSCLSVGPKNYAYQLDNGKTTCKVRGITLNCRASQLVNFETVSNMVKNIHNESNDVITVTEPSRIMRDKHNKDLYTREFKKDYRIVYDKRVIRPDFTTVPYGYTL